MNKPASVGIVGAGIAGLSATIALRLAGHDVTLYEAATELQEIGAGLQISPNGSRLLTQMGVNLDSTVEPDGVELRDGQTGRRIVFTAMADVARNRWGAPYLHVARSDLQSTLLERAAGLGVEPRLGQSIENIAALDHDYTVIADGVNSHLRDGLLGDRKATTCAVAFRAALPATALKNPPPKRAIIWRGSGCHAVTTRIGADAQTVNFVGIVGNENGNLAAFDAFTPDIAAILGASNNMQRWPLYSRAPRFVWGDRVFFVGDASHATLPSAAQGAVMAIEDAVVLADALGHENPAERFVSARTVRVTRVMQTSQKNMKQFHRGQPMRTLENIGAKTIQAIYPEFFYKRLDWLYSESQVTAPFA